MKTKDKLIQIFSNTLNINEEEVLNLSYSNNDSWNSLNHFFLILEIEKEFNVKFSNEEILEMMNFEVILMNLTKHAE